MLDRRALEHAAERVGKVLENDDGAGARVLELVFEFARRVERVDVDAGIARAQHRGHGHGELRHIGQHDGHACAGFEPQALQPGAQPLGELVELAVLHPAVHADRERLVGVLLQRFLDQLRHRGIGARIDRVGNASGVVLQPDGIHAIKALKV
ncbi:hypothetical protein D3C71_1723400 [compost metagenome]